MAKWPCLTLAIYIAQEEPNLFYQKLHEVKALISTIKIMYDLALVSWFDLYGLSWQGCICIIVLKCQEDIINFINCMGLSEYFTSKSCLSFTRWNSRRHFFYNNKSRNRKKISICKYEKFLTFDVKNVLLFWWANSIKTNLQTCNFYTSQSIDYKSVN